MFRDLDRDGFGDPADVVEVCEGDVPPSDVVANGEDCDDRDDGIRPGAEELCDGIDNDCDGAVDADDDELVPAGPLWPDKDQDGYGAGGDHDAVFACPTDGWARQNGDCDDADPMTWPGATEGFGSVDRNCDGLVRNERIEPFDKRPDASAFPPGDWGWDINPQTGSSALWLGEGGQIASDVVDLVDCENPWSRISVTRSEDQVGTRDRLQFEAFEARSLDAGATDDRPRDWSVLLGNRGGTTSFRWSLDGAVEPEHVYLDDWILTCTGPDADGDGIGLLADCDDADPLRWSGCGSCVDADLDGYGTGCDLGPDCDDADPVVFPGAPDIAFDGIDDDCDGEDGPALVLDAESGSFDDTAWSTVAEASLHAFSPLSGDWSLLTNHGALLQSDPIDLSTCPSIEWTVTASVPEAGPSFVALSWFDGVDWVELHEASWVDGIPDDVITRMGTLDDPTAYGPDFALRVEVTDYQGVPVILDDLAVGCGDGDGIATRYDCEPLDPAHWSDCSTCVDLDGDDRGDGCDLGDDCDDTDPLTYPLATDALGDGIDQDCSGADGPGFVEGFERGEPWNALWDTTEGDWWIGGDEIHEGRYTLNVGNDGAAWTSRLLDLSPCDTVEVEVAARVGPNAPDATQELVVAWEKGDTWIDAIRVRGGEVSEQFDLYQAVITDPDVAAADVRIRVATSWGPGTGSLAAPPVTDEFFLDELAVRCGPPDLDDDSVVDELDCAVSDPDHWSDCGSCVDDDGDGRGEGCDLGTDCDEGDASVHRGAFDGLGDGVDTSCDGWDGPLFYDDVEAGRPDEWTVAGDGRWQPVDTGVAKRGLRHRYTYDLGDIEATTPWLDLSGCTDVHVSVERLGEAIPAFGLAFQWWDGHSWRDAPLQPEEDPPQRWVWGRWFADLHEDAAHDRFRLRVVDLDEERDVLGFDELYVGCGEPDADADDIPVPVDCDDDDVDHAFDCETCIDVDGDGYGVGCDLGRDCDEADTTRYHGAIEIKGDGIDQNCVPDEWLEYYDDFEGGTTASFWDRPDAPQRDARMANGWAMEDELETYAVDTSACSSVTWFVRVAQDNPFGDVEVDWHDGSGGWTTLVTIPYGRFYDTTPKTWWGTIDDKAALTNTFHFRWGPYTAQEYSLDSIGFGCTGADGDKDGVPQGVDCDDGDATRQHDCSWCRDADQDGYGTNCALGTDCNDDSAAQHPGLADKTVDGVDQDCSGVDGVGLADSFDGGIVSSTVWGALPPDTRTDAEDGSLLFEDALETVSLDTTSCATVAWSYAAQTYSSVLASSPKLTVSVWTGSAWIVVDELPGSGHSAFETRHGLVVGAAAQAADFKMKFEPADGITIELASFELRCGTGDGDGDGFDAVVDCDDSDPDHWSDCDACTDGDGDGYGEACDLGVDCDDADGGVSPGTRDVFGDGIDVDCDGWDGPSLMDDFDQRLVDNDVWSNYDLRVWPNQGAFDPDYTGWLIRGGYGHTQPFDAFTCPAITLRYMLAGQYEFSPSPIGGDVSVLLHDGADWIPVDTVVTDGNDHGEEVFTTVVDDPTFLFDGVRAGFEGVDLPEAEWWIDDVLMMCSNPDADGDGLPPELDCDDTDARHWEDCTACTDGDGDGFGAGCDLGPDCDDADAAVHPGAPDAFGDGADVDCSGQDGPSWFDDFTERGMDRHAWAAGHTTSTSALVGALRFLRADSWIETVRHDTTSCPAVTWSFGLGTRGTADTVLVSWHDGVDWVDADTWVLDDLYYGYVDDLAVSHGAFGLRMTSTRGTYIDDFEWQCTELDVDGDGVPPVFDCDDNDAFHWSDCEVCIDDDGDGFGSACDLGDDCDDGDDTIFPDASDPYGDGIDADCSLLDGEGFSTGFEREDDPWMVWTGDAHRDELEAAVGGASLRMSGGGGTATSDPLDTAGCAEVGWTMDVQRGPDVPESTDTLRLEYFDGSAWVLVAGVTGNGTEDGGFLGYSGVITDPGALHADFQVRLVSDGSGMGLDDFYVDELGVACW